jgi:hypothetical protein
VTTENGEEFGPVPKSQVDTWVAEGLITPRAQVCQEGDTQWRWASDVYPQLVERASAAEFASAPKDEFKIEPGSGNPYASPPPTYGSSSAHGGYRRKRPHRGGMILTLSILGLVCCWPFSVAAWVMAAEDLRAMKQGAMDRGGEGLTQAGMIIAIVNVAILVFAVLAGILAALA